MCNSLLLAIILIIGAKSTSAPTRSPVQPAPTDKDVTEAVACHLAQNDNAGWTYIKVDDIHDKGQASLLYLCYATKTKACNVNGYAKTVQVTSHLHFIRADGKFSRSKSKVDYKVIAGSDGSRYRNKNVNGKSYGKDLAQASASQAGMVASCQGGVRGKGPPHDTAVLSLNARQAYDNVMSARAINAFDYPNGNSHYNSNMGWQSSQSSMYWMAIVFILLAMMILCMWSMTAVSACCIGAFGVLNVQKLKSSTTHNDHSLL